MSGPLAHQFDYAHRMGWLPFFQAGDYGWPAELLMGIASRESNMGLALDKFGRGDHGNGYGIMQIDRRSYPGWCASGKHRDAQEAIRMGAFVLRSKYNSIQGKVPERDALRVAVALYNGGNAYHEYLEHGDPDRHTTLHNYSRDVLSRTAWFKERLAAMTPTPVEVSVMQAPEPVVTLVSEAEKPSLLAQFMGFVNKSD